MSGMAGLKYENICMGSLMASPLSGITFIQCNINKSEHISFEVRDCYLNAIKSWGFQGHSSYVSLAHPMGWVSFDTEKMHMLEMFATFMMWRLIEEQPRLINGWYSLVKGHPKKDPWIIFAAIHLLSTWDENLEITRSNVITWDHVLFAPPISRLANPNKIMNKWRNSPTGWDVSKWKPIVFETFGGTPSITPRVHDLLLPEQQFEEVYQGLVERYDDAGN